MLEVKICMGTACHLKGSREVIERLQELISAHHIKNDVDLIGKFCLKQCSNKGVSIDVGGEEFDLLPSEVDEFFQKEILGRL